MRTAFAMMRLAVSQIPMGLIPRFLLMAMRRHAKSREILLGSTKEVQIHTATLEREWQRSLDASLKEVQSLLQQ